MDSTLEDFILAHAGDDTAKLLLSFSPGRCGIDIRKAVEIIEARKRIREKIPTFFRATGFDYPGRTAAEQCSSEAAARYRTRFVPSPDAFVADLTCGLGADSFFMSLAALEVVSIERNPEYASAAERNFKMLGANNIKVVNADSSDPALLRRIFAGCGRTPDLIYADPSRRDASDRRKYALEDCSPDITALAGLLSEISPRILVKASPMLDISLICRKFPTCSEISAVSVDNECKELLFLFGGKEARRPQITAVDIDSVSFNVKSSFSATLEEENSAAAACAESAEEIAGAEHLYLPGKALLKAGFFKLPSGRFGLKAVDASTHIYFGNREVPDFPGKTFIIEDVFKYGKQGVREVRKRYPLASVTAMNFPEETAKVRARLGLKESADTHIFACTCASEKILIAASAASAS